MIDFAFEKRTSKLWGLDYQLVKSPVFSVHRIEVVTGGYCSIHSHENKWNKFYVEKGVLVVEVWHKGRGGSPTSRSVLKRKQSITVKPGDFHRFTAHEYTVAYEFYWTPIVSSEDILRRVPGGLLKPGSCRPMTL